MCMRISRIDTRIVFFLQLLHFLHLQDHTTLQQEQIPQSQQHIYI